ncbi:helix-turn-helix transcriptional regulator [Cribrihabitans sp. XS_ASV171]
MAFNPLDSALIRVLTLPQLSPLGRWQVELIHDRRDHLLLWITRGQGIALIDGARVGIGAHNALFVPARQVMSFAPGRQCFGQALLVPDGSDLTLPGRPLHLRVRDGMSQGELTQLFEAMGREQSGDRPLSQSALLAYSDLVGIWLRRHLDEDTIPSRASAARRLSRSFFTHLSRHFADGRPMADHAAALGVTPTHLSRVCKAETGHTAAALVTERVLHAARTLLASTDIPAQDVARHLGFGSPAYFTRFIQQHTGQTPTALRQKAA